MSLTPPDPSLYVRAPVMTVAGGITLCRVVANACPSTMPAFVQKASKRLLEVADVAQAAHASRKKALAKNGEDDVRSIDKTSDNSWGALRGRLENYALLPATKYPDALRAAEIVTSLFGESGLSFLTQRYLEQHAIADSILRRIDAESMAADIDRLAGQEFLENIREQHLLYGKMVGVLLQRENAMAEDLAEHVRAMGQELVDYATKVLASVDRDDPATIQAACAALRPIDVFREGTQARLSKEAEPPKTPEVSKNGS